MSATAVWTVLAELRRHGCRIWIGGGWGVDALVGRQTRPHRDLDLAVAAQDESTAVTALAGVGYEVETDWRPVRVELASPHGWVDLHPVAFDDSGVGHQAGLDGSSFSYPHDAFSTGVIAGRMVPCLSRIQQVRFHTGYRPRAVDLHDLAQLEALMII
jgi:lincosamide nucleotidyltransferase A/C/D/E